MIKIKNNCYLSENQVALPVVLVRFWLPVNGKLNLQNLFVNIHPP